jgi:Tol biopolymer transport system component
MVFTSVRNGDIDLYTMKLDGSDVRQITHEMGYDGGAFFSPDGSKIVWRASRPKPGPELDEYKQLLAQGLIKPHSLDIYVANVDGSDVRRITDNGAANFAPFFLINLDGTGLERVTYFDEFDGFPMWSPDGRTFVFCSNRFNSGPHQTNVFLADWVD